MIQPHVRRGRNPSGTAVGSGVGERVDLVAAGGRQRDLPAVSATVLTHRLGELEPVMQELGRWAARSPHHRRDLAVSVTSLVLSLRTNVDTVLAVVSGGALTIDRGEPGADDTVVTGDPPMIAPMVYGGRPLANAVADGDLAVTGDAEWAERFFALFTLRAGRRHAVARL